ncbi:hypothetical protein [Novosphingobium album (ex Liu et al. 2023)]|uniref:Cytochrome c domain-containing protein n=1 Tax=Novosphingobium album (ex Liu et al. 2023) TaxID=3031130 RepID=A0ABT5WKQ2_9SPHN|nr:hypothetical protein [Novosphingobium album (ex Liu et al. 2023)]MDE8650619.1 hypothetical protein [Novosphingobium album (ex Liu et al. 2023)]
MRLRSVFFLPILLGAACGAIAVVQARPAPRVEPVETALQKRGLAFARQRCSACHAIDAGVSPRPEAPSFETIINTPGLTAETLDPWLRDSHNFPEIMNFTVAPGEIEALAAYMLTLRNSDYRPPIQ